MALLALFTAIAVYFGIRILAGKADSADEEPTDEHGEAQNDTDTSEPLRARDVFARGPGDVFTKPDPKAAQKAAAAAAKAERAAAREQAKQDKLARKQQAREAATARKAAKLAEREAAQHAAAEDAEFDETNPSEAAETAGPDAAPRTDIAPEPPVDYPDADLPSIETSDDAHAELAAGELSADDSDDSGAAPLELTELVAPDETSEPGEPEPKPLSRREQRAAARALARAERQRRKEIEEEARLARKLAASEVVGSVDTETGEEPAMDPAALADQLAAEDPSVPRWMRRGQLHKQQVAAEQGYDPTIVAPPEVPATEEAEPVEPGPALNEVEDELFGDLDNDHPVLVGRGILTVDEIEAEVAAVEAAAAKSERKRRRGGLFRKKGDEPVAALAAGTEVIQLGVSADRIDYRAYDLPEPIPARVIPE